MAFSVRELLIEDESSPYADWFNTLPAVAAAKITTAKARMAQGNLSRVEWFCGIGEYKIDFGPGYRIYIAKDGLKTIVLLGGGTKHRQQTDIDRAVRLWEEYKRRKWIRLRWRKVERGNSMALTRDFKETIIARAQRDTDFAQAIFYEATTLFLNGEADTAKLMLRDLINSTIGFEKLAQTVAKPSKSLHRMLSPSGNPTMTNLAAIFRALKDILKIEVEAHTFKVY